MRKSFLKLVMFSASVLFLIGCDFANMKPYVGIYKPVSSLDKCDGLVVELSNDGKTLRLKSNDYLFHSFLYEFTSKEVTYGKTTYGHGSAAGQIWDSIVYKNRYNVTSEEIRIEQRVIYKDFDTYDSGWYTPFVLQMKGDVVEMTTMSRKLDGYYGSTPEFKSTEPRTCRLKKVN